MISRYLNVCFLKATIKAAINVLNLFKINNDDTNWQLTTIDGSRRQLTLFLLIHLFIYFWTSLAHLWVFIIRLISHFYNLWKHRFLTFLGDIEMEYTAWNGLRTINKYFPALMRSFKWKNIAEIPKITLIEIFDTL